MISLSGFKYNLKDHPFPPFDNLCLSNEVETKGRVRTNKKIIAVRSF